jgi:hypothetical protein
MEIVKFLRIQWDRLTAVVAAIVGVVALLLGYFGISGTPHVAAQLPYIISGGMFGLFALGIAGMAWISADLRDEWRELRALRELMQGDAEHGANGRTTGFANSGAPPWSDEHSRPPVPDSSLIDNSGEVQEKVTVSEARRPRTRTRPLRATQAVDDAGRTPEQ